MESHKDNDEDSENKDGWGIMYVVLMRALNMTIEEISHLSYPQFKLLSELIYEPSTFEAVIPYMGSSEEDKKTTEEIETPEEFAVLISQMNSDFR